LHPNDAGDAGDAAMAAAIPLSLFAGSSAAARGIAGSTTATSR
jgi:hypothetical protein